MDQLIEKFGIYFDEIGLSKTYGRLFGLFMTLQEPVSMGDLVTKLQISKSTASVELRRLLRMGCIEKVLLPQRRADFYRLKPDVWETQLLQKMRMIERLQSILEEVPSEELEARKNLKEMRGYCDFMQVELKGVADRYMSQVKADAASSCIVEGREGQRFVVEWSKEPALSEAFYQKMQKLAPLGIEAFREIEMDFLRAHPQAAQEDLALAAFAGLSGAQLQEAVEVKLEKMLCTHPNKLSDQWRLCMQDVYYYLVTIREEKSEKILGFITFMGGGFMAEGELKITILAVDKDARRLGLAGFLVHSLKEIGISYTKLLVSTRVSNQVAINAYCKWGFCEDVEMSKKASSHFVSGHWVHLSCESIL